MTIIVFSLLPTKIMGAATTPHDFYAEGAPPCCYDYCIIPPDAGPSSDAQDDDGEAYRGVDNSLSGGEPPEFKRNDDFHQPYPHHAAYGEYSYYERPPVMELPEVWAYFYSDQHQRTHIGVQCPSCFSKSFLGNPRTFSGISFLQKSCLSCPCTYTVLLPSPPAYHGPQHPYNNHGVPYSHEGGSHDSPNHTAAFPEVKAQRPRSYIHDPYGLNKKGSPAHLAASQQAGTPPKVSSPNESAPSTIAGTPEKILPPHHSDEEDVEGVDASKKAATPQEEIAEEEGTASTFASDIADKKGDTSQAPAPVVPNWRKLAEKISQEKKDAHKQVSPAHQVKKEQPATARKMAPVELANTTKKNNEITAPSPPRQKRKKNDGAFKLVGGAEDAKKTTAQQAQPFLSPKEARRLEAKRAEERLLADKRDQERRAAAKQLQEQQQAEARYREKERKQAQLKQKKAKEQQQREAAEERGRAKKTAEAEVAQCERERKIGLQQKAKAAEDSQKNDKKIVPPTAVRTALTHATAIHVFDNNGELNLPPEYERLMKGIDPKDFGRIGTHKPLMAFLARICLDPTPAFPTGEVTETYQFLDHRLKTPATEFGVPYSGRSFAETFPKHLTAIYGQVKKSLEAKKNYDAIAYNSEASKAVSPHDQMVAHLLGHLAVSAAGQKYSPHHGQKTRPATIEACILDAAQPSYYCRFLPDAFASIEKSQSAAPQKPTVTIKQILEAMNQARAAHPNARMPSIHLNPRSLSSAEVVALSAVMANTSLQ